ncbi:MAG: ORC complex protein Cdc6/Orc1 [Methanomicrobiales archaeon 53_19]|uniref:AAA family ATPase n=1 Tax=Methanocalculus sp. TaxID=2004547 RepID=UPI000749E15F|nr:AAA family ATPase [Methanocalculus sp.]KUL02403.1 MAG: ORC complex protein Cdc6/Orc1 [Methanomicrobiales archaeon 53_19]HIJ05891.1 AAA family ATPase [Methanocalculus sp.]
MNSESSSQIVSRNFTFSEKTLFKDADILECDHIPDQVLFRDAELEEMAFLIRPGLRGQRPANILCRGLPATGKTTCIHHLFAELREVSHTLIPVYVNCQQNRSAFAVFSIIYRELVGHAPPGSGIPLRRLMDAVAKALQSRRQSERSVLLVCLDDIHHLIHEGTDTQILSSLLRIYLDYPGCRASVILVESDLALDISRRLDRSVFSSLCMEEVFFAPYSAAQIRGILRERARQAVYPTVISPEILDLITDMTASTVTGDLRVGIDLLKSSILRAERTGRPAVTEEDVAAAFGDARTTHLRGLVTVLTEKERRLLSVMIAGMVEEGEEAGRKEYGGDGEYGEPVPPTSGRLYSRLLEVLAAEQSEKQERAMKKRVMEQGAIEQRSGEPVACAEPDPGYSTDKGPDGKDGKDGRRQDEPQLPAPTISYTSFYEQLRSLATYALIRISVRQAKGRTSEITLRYPAADVKRICEGR